LKSPTRAISLAAQSAGTLNVTLQTVFFGVNSLFTIAIDELKGLI
jgi:hypothetical protein